MGPKAKSLFPESIQQSQKAIGKFFCANSPDSVHDTLWHVFKAWVNCPADKRAQYSDEEIALFLDQLVDLVAAAFQLHQANRVDETLKEDGRNG